VGKRKISSLKHFNRRIEDAIDLPADDCTIAGLTATNAALAQEADPGQSL
jgi:hypothetical protein